MKTPRFLPLLGALLVATALQAQNPDKTQIDHLHEKARQAKAEGRGDEAERLIGEAKRLQAEPREREGKAGEGDKFARVKREIEELQRAGKHDEANQLARKLSEAMGRREGDLPKAEGPERVRHVFEAVKHLRVAGLNEPAEHLEQMARRMGEEFEQREHASAENREKVQHDVQRQMQELHGEMRKMAHAIEELQAQLRKSRGEEKKD